jgi:hypothetical protein
VLAFTAVGVSLLAWGVSRLDRQAQERMRQVQAGATKD